MASSQELYNIRLKTSLFEAKLCYNDFKKLFYYKGQEIWRHEELTVLQKKPRQQVCNF